MGDLKVPQKIREIRFFRQKIRQIEERSALLSNNVNKLLRIFFAGICLV